MALVAWIVGVEAAGALSALLARRGAWYDALAKPAWAPPEWLHAPLAVMLYGTLAVAGWLIWRMETKRESRTARMLFASLLLLAVLWGPLFFGGQRPDLAMLDISALWVANVLAIRIFHRIRPVAAWLLIPCLAWATGTGALTLSIWLRNG